MTTEFLAKTQDWTTKLAAQLFAGEQLTAFLALPLKSQLVGLAVFAHIGGETQVKDQLKACLALFP